MVRICAVVFCFLFGSIEVANAADKQEHLALNPMLSADHIRALRPNLRETVLRAKFLGARGDAMEIVAGADYGVWMEHDYTNIFDYRLYRRFKLNQEESTFVSRSIFADVNYAHDVMWARMVLLKLLLSEGKKPGAVLPPHRADLYWLATDLGDMPVLDDYTGATQTDLPHGGFSLTYQGRVVVQFEPAEILFPAAFVDVFYRVVQENIQVHPKAVAAMKATGRIPKLLKTVYWEKRLDRFIEGELNLQHAEEVVADYPLPGNWQAIADPALTDAFKADFLRPMLYALANPSKAPRRGMQQYSAAIEAALARGDKLDAALIMQEGIVTKQIPCPKYPVACTLMNDVRIRTADDREVEKLNEAIKLDYDGKPHEAGSVFLSIPRDGLKAGYMLDIYFGNSAAQLFALGTNFTPEQLGGISKMALSSYSEALRANPWVTGLYDDIAKFLLRNHRPYDAWFAWGVGYGLYGPEEGGLIENVEHIEKQLMKDVPWKFGLPN